ncbi:MAG: hypothetical protein WBF33_01400 [Candidatus Nitrosopolaris sp.]
MKKTLATVVIAATILVLSLAATVLGARQSKPFDNTTVPQEIIDAYKSGLPFKQYVSLTIKNPGSVQLIKQELGHANIECGEEGVDVRTNKVVCDQAISFMNQTCSVDPSISRNCEQVYIPQYLHAQNLNESKQSKLSYVFLAQSAALNHPGTSEAELLELTRSSK